MPRTKNGCRDISFPVLAFVVLCFAFAFFLRNLSQLPSRPRASFYLNRPHKETSKPSHLRLVVSTPDVVGNTCRSILSAAVLGYPTPHLVSSGDESPRFNRISRFEGALTHLESLGAEYDDDLMLIVDGEDVWFQLRPQILVERYFDIIHQNQERIETQYGKEAVRSANLTAKVVFAAQKSCWPTVTDHPACWAVPESTLAPNIYGPDTDRHLFDETNPISKYRQKYLHTASMMGPVGTLREIIRRAMERASEQFDAEIEQFEQTFLAEMFGEQEYARRLRFDGPEKMKSWPDAPDFDQRNYEFGICLDYDSRLLLAAQYSDSDAMWVRRSDSDDIHAAFEEAGVEPWEMNSPILQGRPKGSNSKSTYHNINEESAHRPFERFSTVQLGPGWNEVPLFTNLWTGVSPVAIHHDPNHDHPKFQLKTDWPLMWFQPYLRKLLDDYAESPVRPVAVINQKEWWSPSVGKDGVGSRLGFLVYESICADGLEKELFQDGKGPWRSPISRELI